MIDFQKLVLEAIASPAPLYQYYKDVAELTTIRTFLEQKFNITSPWPAPEGIFPNLASISSRGGVESLIRVADSFPLFDFIWYTAEQENPRNVSGVLSTTSAAINIDSAKINQYETSFKTSCESFNPGTSLDPIFGYKPISGAGNRNLRVLEKKIANNAIGKLSLATYNGFSIRKSFYGLLEARKKTRKAVLKTANIPESNKFIDGILTNPAAYTNLKQIPKEISKLYTISSTNIIIEIAIAMHEFFDAELVRFNIKNPKITFDDFISNKPLDSTNNYNIINQPSGLTSPVNKPAEPLPGKGGYIITNIRKVNTPSSKNLIEELEKFANYISDGESTDWSEKLGAATQIAQAGMLGTKMAGT